MADSNPRPWSETEEMLIRLLNRYVLAPVHVWLYRLSGGRIGARFGGAPVLLLTTTGRRSGEQRVVPLIYLRNGENLVIVASRAGTSQNPVWYLNLEADPNVEVELGGERQKMLARRASEDEKAAVGPALVQLYADYDRYRTWTERNIPVVILSRS